MEAWLRSEALSARASVTWIEALKGLPFLPIMTFPVQAMMRTWLTFSDVAAPVTARTCHRQSHAHYGQRRAKSAQHRNRYRIFGRERSIGPPRLQLGYVQIA